MKLNDNVESYIVRQVNKLWKEGKLIISIRGRNMYVN